MSNRNVWLEFSSPTIRPSGSGLGPSPWPAAPSQTQPSEHRTEFYPAHVCSPSRKGLGVMWRGCAPISPA